MSVQQQLIRNNTQAHAGGLGVNTAGAVPNNVAPITFCVDALETVNSFKSLGSLITATGEGA